MFITKRRLSRRTVLRSIGASVALPFLEAMVPAATALRNTPANPRPRLAAIEIVHGAAGSTDFGVQNHFWSPSKEGTNFEFTLSLKSLEPFRDYVTIVSNTDCANAAPSTAREVGGDHPRSSAVYLTGAHPKMTEGSDYFCGTSMDQIYAQKSGQDTPLSSIQLCIENVGALTGACGFGYSCVYTNSISWQSPTRPLPMEMDPRVLFERLFGDGATTVQRDARRRGDRSVLDVINDKVAGLRKDLDAGDRRKLNEYFESVREVEQRIEKLEKYNSSGAPRQLPTAPIGVPDSFDEHVQLMMDLQVLAFQSEVTRVSAFKMGRDVSSRIYPASGVKTPFHALSHHGENPDKIAEFARLNEYHVSFVSYFLDRLRNTPDGDGNLLDHTVVMYGSPMGNSHIHNHKKVPLFLAGRANGQLKGNLHYVANEGTPMANVLLTVLSKLGVELDTIGDSTGTLLI